MFQLRLLSRLRYLASARCYFFFVPVLLFLLHPFVVGDVSWVSHLGASVK